MCLISRILFLGVAALTLVTWPAWAESYYNAPVLLVADEQASKMIETKLNLHDFAEDCEQSARGVSEFKFLQNNDSAFLRGIITCVFPTSLNPKSKISFLFLLSPYSVDYKRPTAVLLSIIYGDDGDHPTTDLAALTDFVNLIIANKTNLKATK